MITIVDGRSVSVIVDYIDQQYEKYLNNELDERRNPAGIIDSRIHACIYFISPTGNGFVCRPDAQANSV